MLLQEKLYTRRLLLASQSPRRRELHIDSRLPIQKVYTELDKFLDR